MQAGPGPQRGTLTPIFLRLLCCYKAGEAQKTPSPKSSVILFGLENSCLTPRPGLWCCSRLPFGGRQTDQRGGRQPLLCTTQVQAAHCPHSRQCWVGT